MNDWLERTDYGVRSFGCWIAAIGIAIILALILLQ